MSDFRYIFSLIKRGEDQRLDFKQHITSASKIAKTIAAFANSEGGLIVTGIDDQGEITGVDVQQERHMLIKAGRKYCDPVVFVHFERYSAHRKNVLIARIEKAKGQQVHAKDEQGRWLPYVRIKDQTVLMPGLEEQEHADKYNLNPIPILMEKNEGLLNYLEQNDAITIKEYMKLMNISYHLARRSLNELHHNGVLRLEEMGNKEYYYLNHPDEDAC